MRRLRTKVGALAVSLLGLLGLLTVVGTQPASASSCNLYGWVNPGGSHATYYPQTVYGYWYSGAQTAVAWRAWCYVVGVVTQPDGYTYQFAVRVQDANDYSVDTSNFEVDDAGQAIVRRSLAGGGWTTVVTDTNSLDFAFNQSLGYTTYYSPWYDARVVGNPENFARWWLRQTTHWRVHTSEYTGSWVTETYDWPTYSIFTVHG